MSNAEPATPLDAAGWERVRALFDLALGLLADMREGFVRSAGDTDAVRDEVLALLQHSTDAGAVPSGLLNPRGSALLAPQRDGLRLGPWRLDVLIGAGGMGDIYRASRADGVYAGAAAVKVLKRGMDSARVLQRFALEQQALATLNHPHIARLFDAGLTPDGLPYFVMELVDGQPIDAACQGLPLPKRLEIFLQLADAVAYAHRMLLVHRDLKPGNVMVTPAGQVKLLDFGIAKALDVGDAATDITGDMQRSFTPSHASPEQVRGERVGTATDIYSLGVLLYQLLTGQRPYGRGAVSPAEAARAVLEEEPTRPSSLSPVDASDRAWLVDRAKLKGDLDSILLKALEKPLDRRYSSVDALATDVRAYLTGHPVSAHEHRRTYLAAKFIGRHRLVVSVALASACAILSLTAAALVNGSRASANLAESQRLAAVMVFDVNDALTRSPLDGRMALNKTASDFFNAQLQGGATSAPALLIGGQALARLAEVEGQAGKANLGDAVAARQHILQALALFRRIPDRSPQASEGWRGQANAHRDLAALHASAGDAVAALQESSDALQAADRGLAIDPKNLNLVTARCNVLMGSTDLLYSQNGAAHLGRLGEAITRGEETVACGRENLLRRADNINSQQLLSGALVRLSLLKLHAGRIDDAVALARENLAAIDKFAGPAPDGDWTDFLLSAHGTLGFALLHRTDDPEAFAALARSVDIARRARNVDPADRHARQSFASVSFTLGDAHLGVGHMALADHACSEAVAALRTAVLADAHADEVQPYLAARRCALEAKNAPLPALESALREADALTARLTTAGDERLTVNEMRMLRAALRVERGDFEAAFNESRNVLAALDALVRENPSRTELISRATGVRARAAALPWRRLSLEQTSMRCTWVHDAVAAFDGLRQTESLSTEFKSAALRVEVLARWCSTRR